MAAATPIDFSGTSLSKHYSNFFAKILDDVFTPSECASLIALASSSDDWKPAGMGTEPPHEAISSRFRHSERILRIDAQTADMIYERLRPLVDEIHQIPPGGKWERVTVRPGKKQGPTWKMVGINPRLSFLRYGPGHYFKPHCDGLVELHNGNRPQKSFVTLHLYLNDSAEGDSGLLGGATRFWSPDKKHFMDVEPRMGRVLVFQQRMLIHSGEEVKEGVKYTVRSDFMFEKVAE